MSLTEQVKKLALSNDLDYVRIAPVDRFIHAPRGHRPTDLLPGAKSVISLGVRINQGPQLTQRMFLADYPERRLRHISFSYKWLGYGMLNLFFIDRAGSKITQLIEKEGEVALPMVSSGVENSRALMGAFSNRHAAVAAGVGELGWNGICLTPDVGPRARFGSVITTAELDPDPMYHGPKLCNPDNCKELGDGLPLCVRVCPLNLFSRKRSVKAEIGERTFEYALMDHFRCGRLAGFGLHPRFGGPPDIVIPKKVDVETAVKLMAHVPPRYALESLGFGRGHFCGLCLLRCPVGSPKQVDEIMKGKEAV